MRPVPGSTRTSRDVRFRAAIGGIADVDVLYLTLLAPDVIEMILDGRQPLGLQFEQFRKSLHSNGKHDETPYRQVNALSQNCKRSTLKLIAGGIVQEISSRICNLSSNDLLPRSRTKNLLAFESSAMRREDRLDASSLLVEASDDGVGSANNFPHSKSRGSIE